MSEKTSRPRQRCAFLIYETPEAARCAQQALHNSYKLRGSRIQVTFARKSADKGQQISRQFQPDLTVFGPYTEEVLAMNSLQLMSLYKALQVQKRERHEAPSKMAKTLQATQRWEAVGKSRLRSGATT
ncbi:unnamed protein product, partial [Symbiodinium pilosum]